MRQSLDFGDRIEALRSEVASALESGPAAEGSFTYRDVLGHSAYAVDGHGGGSGSAGGDAGGHDSGHGGGHSGH